MPELPEVETVKTGLNELVKNKKIKSVNLIYPKMILNDESDFINKLTDSTIKGIRRRGKFLIFDLDNGYSFLSHLRMEGKYQLHESNEIPGKHVHVVFHFMDGKQLWYLDTRKFGRMHLMPTQEIMNSKELSKLGPEPLTSSFKLDEFKNRLRKRNKNIKNVLLDQTAVVGLGNIYVDEVLFASKVHPLTKAQNLSDTEIKEIYENTKLILNEAINSHGTTVKSYKNAMGHAGSYQDKLKVYGRAGQPCVVCGNPIQKIKVSGRGTHFCETCQIFHGDES